jgi:multidrug efflux pump subunit AcrA (membrane-fusion protein)
MNAPPLPPPVAPAPAAPVDLAAAIKSAGPHRATKLWWLLGVVVVALGVGGWWWWRRAQAEKNQPPPYATEVLARGDINLVITATGNLVPTNEVTVGSELSGTTLEVYADINDRVTKGQSLAKLDTSKLAQQTAISRASVVSAQAKVAQADATVQESAAALGRVQELSRLSGGRVPAKSDLDAAVAAADRARADAASARAAVGEAEAQVHINENDLAKALIKSPIDGIVLTRSIEPGQTVAASFTAPQLFVIAEKLEHMKLNVAIAEADIGRVAAPQPALLADPGQRGLVDGPGVLQLHHPLIDGEGRQARLAAAQALVVDVEVAAVGDARVRAQRAAQAAQAVEEAVRVTIQSVPGRGPELLVVLLVVHMGPGQAVAGVAEAVGVHQVGHRVVLDPVQPRRAEVDRRPADVGGVDTTADAIPGLDQSDLDAGGQEHPQSRRRCHGLKCRSFRTLP